MASEMDSVVHLSLLLAVNIGIQRLIHGPVIKLPYHKVILNGVANEDSTGSILPDSESTQEPNTGFKHTYQNDKNPNSRLISDIVGNVEAPTVLSVPGTTGAKDSTHENSFSPVMPADESPEDAALRREMIQYNMQDIGAIVAELDLDENGSDTWSDEDDGDCEDDEDGSSTDEDEDRFGRATRRVVTDAYTREMEALEKKLNIQSMRNLGPGGSNSDKPELGSLRDDRTQDNPKIKGKDGILLEPHRSFETMDALHAGKPTKETSSIIPMDDSGVPRVREITPVKQVHFAEGLDIQDASAETAHKSSAKQLKSTSALPDDMPAIKSSNVSRFKSGRIATSTIEMNDDHPETELSSSITSKKPISDFVAPPTIPNPPASVYSNTVIERPFNPSPVAQDPSSNEHDPALLHQQLSTEYYRLRNRMIQRQGGFLASAEEEANDGRVELEDGKKKMSRFRAARLRTR